MIKSCTAWKPTPAFCQEAYNYTLKRLNARTGIAPYARVLYARTRKQKTTWAQTKTAVRGTYFYFAGSFLSIIGFTRRMCMCVRLCVRFRPMEQRLHTCRRIVKNGTALFRFLLWLENQLIKGSSCICFSWFDLFKKRTISISHLHWMQCGGSHSDAYRCACLRVTDPFISG